MTEAEFSRLLDLVYEAALEPETWAAVMERVADLLGGTSAWLSQLNVEDGSGGGIITRIDPRMPTVYREHFALRNPLANVADPRAYMRGWAPRILSDEDWMPKEALVRSEYYNDFLKPQDIHSTLMIRLAARGFDISVLNINRPERRAQFGPTERELAARLQPHLIRAFNLGQKIAERRSLNAGLADILDRSPHALFLLDGAGAVRHLNRPA
ncbi:MAG: hypothetical protein H0X27_08215, partial [Caulobacteraceae bacterium]|nr:hypothetical protein [Caulobacteraceae bacterium]